MSEGELILYRTDDGRTEIQLRTEGDTVWLTQAEIAVLFATTKQNVSLHVANILKEGELSANSVVKESLTTAADSRRKAEAIEADAEDLQALEALEKQAKGKGKGGKT